jgi:hypothetical protein
MNKLEQQIFDEFDRFEKFSQYVSKQDGARMAAKIALELAEKAHLRGYLDYEDNNAEGDQERGFEQIKQEILGI